MSVKLRMLESRMARVATERDYTQTVSTLPVTAKSCDECAYPAQCRADRLCWKAEKTAIAADRAAPKRGPWTRENIIEAIQEWKRAKGSPPVNTDWERADATHPSVQTVRRLFGTWSDALRAAGFEPLGPWGKPRGSRRFS